MLRLEPCPAIRRMLVTVLQPHEFSIVVVDEAQHALAPSYRRIFDHFDLFEAHGSRYLIGFTATRTRG